MLFITLGRRMCLGEQLAKMEIYLLLSNLLLRYNITLPDGFTPPSDQDSLIPGIIRTLIPYEAIFTER